MSRKPQPPAPIRWDILYAGKNAKLLLGKVEAADEREAVAKAAEQFQNAGDEANRGAAAVAITLSNRFANCGDFQK
jgi:hypothetical protein